MGRSLARRDPGSAQPHPSALCRFPRQQATRPPRKIPAEARASTVSSTAGPEEEAEMGAQIGMQVRGQIGLWLKNENVIQIVVLHYDFIEYAMICDLWFSCFA